MLEWIVLTSKYWNWGRYSRFWTNNSLTIALASAGDNTATVSGSWAMT
jgi:hypothetical protein